MTAATRAASVIFDPVISTVFNPVRSSAGTLVNLPLKSTTEGTFTGSSSFTRATIATVEDFEGLIKTVLSGEVRFSGARREHNLATASEGDVTLGNWSAVQGMVVAAQSGITPPDVPAFAGRTPDVSLCTFSLSDNASQIRFNFSEVIGNTYRYSGWVRSVSGTVSGARASVGGASIFTFPDITTEWVRFSFAEVNNNSTAFFIRTNNAADLGPVYVLGLQVEDVTGQSDQNPGNYVSVGVESSPFHGAHVDAVQYFETENGNTVSSNVVTEATGAAIADATLVGYLREPAATNLILNSDVMVTQVITTTAAERTLSFTGTGTLTLTGTSTAGPLVGTGANDRVQLTYTPTAGALTLTVSGTVEMAQDELGAPATSWIPTEGSTVTRDADALPYPTAGNFEDAAGTVIAEVTATDWTNAAGQILGDGTEAPLLADTTNSGIQSFDGTNTASGPAGAPTGTVSVGARWSGTSLEAISGGVAGTPASYDGAFSLAQLDIGEGAWSGNIRNIRIFNKSLTDTQISGL